MLAGGPVQVEQRHPQFQLLLRVILPVLLQHLQQARLSAFVVAVGIADGRFFKIGFVHESLQLDNHRGNPAWHGGAERRVYLWFRLQRSVHTAKAA